MALTTNKGAQMNGNHAPSPPHSTEKTFYQSRMGVTPTRTPGLAFRNTKEDGLRMMAPSLAMEYTSINDAAPTAMEKGIARDQTSMGKYSNTFGDNI